MKKKKENNLKNLLERSVFEILDKKSLEDILNSRKKIRIKFGIDPTSPNIHLGRTIPLLKLRDFQILGHKIILIIGDFTALIGDNSDKEAERLVLTEAQVKLNLLQYKKQIGKILDLDKVEFVFNSKWLKKLKYDEISRQSSIFSISDFLARENIKKRLEGGKRISLREVLYPLMQGFDSVEVRADLEVGGTDQRFNLLAGRKMQKEYGQKPQNFMTLNIINGSDGRKMSSSWGNTINLLDLPDDMFGKVMRISDELMIEYFILLTRVDLEDIEVLETIHPRDCKEKLAFEITRMYHGESKALIAKNNFLKQFSLKSTPDNVLEVKIKKEELILDFLVKNNLVRSRNEARQKIKDNALYFDNKIIESFNFKINSSGLIKLGRKLLKVKKI